MKLKIYFDGACYLCSSEMNHYRKKDLKKNFDFIDISQANFDASSEGLDPEKVMKIMHVKDAQGKIYTGVDAFLEIWKLLPWYKQLVPIAQLYGVKQLLCFGYIVFAHFRKYLPKKSQQCSNNRCYKK